MATTANTRLVARFGGTWTLLRDPLELLREGQVLRLQELPLRILEVLIARPGELVTREELTTRLWPKGFVEFDAGLNTAMRKLRAALGDDADAPSFIETVPRQGYRFVGAVETESVALAAPASASTIPPAARPSWQRARILIPALIAILAGVGFLVWRSAESPREMATAATTRVRIAILPFENLSPDSADAFFADGMHEEVLNSLAGRTQNIDVISRATMMSYRNAKQSPRDIARALSASHLLAGTVRREGTHVRISVTLIDGANDNLLWSQRFDRELNDAMTLQSEVAGSVAERLAVRFVSGPGTLPPSRNAQAYDLWLRGVLAWQNGASGPGRPVEEMQRVEDLYSQAIELDPDFAAAYADRARVRSQFYISGWDVSDANLDEARADLAVARRLAGDAPHVLVREATFVALIDDDIKGSLEKFARAEAVGPLTADFLMSKANFLRLAGRIDEALAADANAARLDPANPTISIFWMRNLLSVRRFAEATQVADAFEQRVPGSIERGESIFAYTGSTARWRAEVELQKGGDSLLGLSSEAALMRVEGHSAELLQRLEALGDATYRQRPSLGFLIAATPVPIAELRGWERLLAGDSVAAAREGRRLLDFLAKQPLPRRSVWWPKLLGAEGALFVGDRRRAIADARAVLATAGNSPHIAIALHSRARVARILAWAGEKEAAIALLEELSAPALSMGPAEVTRDPLFVKPLEGEPRYKALRARLENEIAVNARAL